MLCSRILFSLSKVKNFGVVGAGQMGTGIAIVANRVAGLNVTLVDNDLALKKAQDFIQKWIVK
jgi:3-hydroxybutyryl-CoA dehydrogenase